MREEGLNRRVLIRIGGITKQEVGEDSKAQQLPLGMMEAKEKQETPGIRKK